MEKWTIGCPMCSRGEFLHELWLQSFDRLDIDRSKFDIVWMDVNLKESERAIFNVYMDRHREDFNSFRFIKCGKKRYKVIADDLCANHPEFIEKRESVAETIRALQQQIDKDSHFVLWEDDIIVPPNAFKVLKHVFDWDKDILGVTGVQYSRNALWSEGKSLLIWDWDIPNWNKNIDEMPVHQVRHWNAERFTGIEFIGASATGFILLRKEFYHNHIYVSADKRGQDIMTGWDIFNQSKKLALVWDVKMPHLGIDMHTKRFRIYRSPMCQTDVFDNRGISYD